MAQQLHRVIANVPGPFDMRALMRLAIWGTAAAASLSVAVLASYANPAAQRLMGTIAAAIGPPQRRADASPMQIASRTAEADIEARHLADAVRALAADRNELLARISVLEQSLDDITGTINRQTAAATPPAPPATDTSVLSPLPMIPPTAVEMISPPLGPVAAAPEEFVPPNQIANLPVGGAAEADLLKPKNESKGELAPEFGIDIGGAVNFDALRVLWNSIKAGHGVQLDGLSPLVAVRENNKSRAAELRLIVGPLPDAGAATRLCVALSASSRACQPTPFVGQHFVLSAPERERKPAPPPSSQPVRPNH